MSRACRCGPALRSHLPPATERCISPNGILSTARRNTQRFPLTRYPELVDEHPTRNTTMKDVFAKLLTDFLSTIVFLAIYLTTDNVVLATSVAIAGAVGQVIYSRVKGRTLGYMTWASLALVV